jgi:nucleoid DNA-binding protein
MTINSNNLKYFDIMSILSFIRKRIFKKGNKSEKLKSIIEKGSEIGGSVTGAGIGLLIAGPIGAIGGAAVGPLVAQAFKKIGNDISEKLMSPREQARIGATFSLALEKIVKSLEKGEKIRVDGFFNVQDQERSQSETILEGTLLKARNEYEEKKIKFYSNFLANMCLDSTVSFERGNTLLRILEQLSYRQIAILAYFGGIESLNTDRWMISFKDKSELGEYQDFYSELINLYNQQLLQQWGGGISMSVGSMGISPLGMTMYNLINGEEVDIKDVTEVQKTIELIKNVLRK